MAGWQSMWTTVVKLASALLQCCSLAALVPAKGNRIRCRKNSDAALSKTLADFGALRPGLTSLLKHPEFRQVMQKRQAFLFK